MTELSITTHAGLMPALTIGDAVDRYNIVVEFTKAIMKPGQDYGVIPGTDKPTLLKPGAEKLCSLFGLAPDFVIVESIVDFDKGLFYYHYKCRLSRDGFPVGEGEGSANSMEKKYRYRNIPEWKATDEEKERAIRIETRKSKKGNDYKVVVLENEEPFDLINTLQKMAQKRALVAATLIAANASEFFTQDVEDMVTIEGHFVEDTQPEPPPAQKAKPAKKSTNGNRPYPPEVVRDKIAEVAAFPAYVDYEANDNQRNLLRYGLELCFPGDKNTDDKRHTLLKYIAGTPSTKEVSGGVVKAMLDKWLTPEKDDDTGDYSISPMAVKEAQTIITAALADEGQQALL